MYRLLSCSDSTDVYGDSGTSFATCRSQPFTISCMNFLTFGGRAFGGVGGPCTTVSQSTIIFYGSKISRIHYTMEIQFYMDYIAPKSKYATVSVVGKAAFLIPNACSSWYDHCFLCYPFCLIPQSDGILWKSLVQIWHFLMESVLPISAVDLGNRLWWWIYSYLLGFPWCFNGWNIFLSTKVITASYWLSTCGLLYTDPWIGVAHSMMAVGNMSLCKPVISSESQ